MKQDLASCRFVVIITGEILYTLSYHEDREARTMYMEQEEQIMEWYYDGITLEKAKHLAELSFGPSVIDLVESIYTYGEDYEMMSSEGVPI